MISSQNSTFAPSEPAAHRALLRRALPLALMLGVLTIFAPGAQAQLTASILALDGRNPVPSLINVGSTTGTPLGIADCDRSIEFRFNGIDVTRANLHVYWGASCSDPTVRNDTTDTTCTDLSLEYAVESNSMKDVPIAVSSLLDCDSAGSGQRTIFVLAINDNTSTVTEAGQEISFPIAYDFDAPATPAGIAASDGEATTTLTWDGTTSEITSFELYFDPDGCADGATPTGSLTTDTPDSNLLLDSTLEGTRTSADLEWPTSVSVGQSVAIGIRAVDRAENVGPLAVTCSTRIQTQSFWDAYCTGRSDGPCGSDGCSVSPGRRGGEGRGAPLGLMLLGLIWLGHARRRRGPR